MLIGSTPGSGDPTWPKGYEIFHAIECHVQCVDWGQLVVRDQSLLRDRLCIDQRVVSKFTLRHLDFIPLLSPIIIIKLFLIVKVFSSQSMSFNFLSILILVLSTLLLVLSCWLELNCDNILHVIQFDA